MIRNQNQKLIFMVVIGFFLSFSFVSAKNFTIFNATNVNQPYFSVNGTSGYVGVGTTNPTALFNVKQPNDNDTSANGFRLTNFDGSSYFSFYINSLAGGGNPRFSTNKSLVFEAGSAIFLRSSGTTYFNDGTPRNTNFNNGQLYLQSGGNLGISTTTPAFKLDVNGTAQFNQPVIVGTPTANNHAVTKSYVDSAAAAVGGGVGTGTSGQTLRNNGTSWVANSTLYNNGTNIGIGTTGPTQKLDVNGGMHLSLGEGLDFVSNGDYYGATADARIVRMVDTNGTNGGVDGGITFERYTSTDSVAIDVLTLRGSGNVGIGTISPVYKLDVNGSAQFNSTVIVGTPTASNHAATKSYVDSAAGGGVGTGISGQTLRHNGTNWVANSLLYNNGTNVGIGTTNPRAKLDIYGNVSGGRVDSLVLSNVGAANNSATAIYMGYQQAGLGFYGARILQNGNPSSTRSSDLLFQIHGGTADNADTSWVTPLMIQRDTGNVGIGTVSPTYKLDVNGTAQFNQPVIVGTPTATNHATTKSYVDSALSGGSGSTVGYWAMNGTNISNSNSGNVGIGTTAPGAKLQVNGDIRLNMDSTYVNRKILTISRAITTGAGSWVNLGSVISSGQGTYVTIYQSNHHNGTINAAVYEISDVYYSGSTVDWMQVPTSNYRSYTGVQDYAIDVRRTANHGTANLEIRARALTSSSGAGTLQFEIQTNGTFVADSTSGTGATVSGFLSRNVYQFPVSSNRFAASSDGLFIVNSGNVGIGTTTPAAMLDVQGTLRSSAGKFSVDTPGNITAESFYDLTNALYKLDPSNTNESMKIAGTIGSLGTATNNYFMGNVGVGTTAPSQQLEITKNFRMPSTIYTNGSTGVVYKDGNRFIHDFNYGNNGTVTTSGRNTFLGINAGNFTMGSTATSASHASYNTGIGYQSLFSNTTGYNNSALGYASLLNNTTGSYNSALGMQSLYANITGNNNSALGHLSLMSNVAGNYGVAVGSESQRYANNTATSWTNSNTSVGYQALRGGTDASLNTGASNSVLGYQAMVYNTSGSNNSVVGAIALLNNSTGSYNSVLGYQALYSNTTGNYNSAVGMYSLLSNISGSNNTAIGVSAGRYIADGSTGKTTGNYSLYLGYNSKAYANGTNNENVIGYNAIGLGSNTVVLGNDSITTTALKGNVGIGTTTPQSTLDVNGIIKMRNATITQPEDVINKSYLDSALDVVQSAYWNLSGSNLHTASTSWNVGIGTTNPLTTFHLEHGVVSSNATGFRIKNSSSSQSWIIDTGIPNVNESSFSLKNVNSATFPLVINSSDNVGIGTTNPQRALHIYKNGSPALRLESASSNQGIEMITQADKYSWLLGAQYNVDGAFEITPSTAVNGTTFSTPVAVFKQSGNVGIGTTNPQGLLDLYNNGGSNLRLMGAVNSANSGVIDLFEGNGLFGTSNTYGARLVYNGVDNKFYIQTGAQTTTSTRLSIDRDSGNVGIGTTSPSYKLDVAGTGQFTQPVIVGTPTANNHAVTKSYLDSALGNPVGSGTSGQTLRNNGTSWVANSLLYNNGTNIGIGTISPSASLDVFGKIKVTSGGTIYNTDNGRYLDMTGTLADSLKVSGDIYSTAGELKTDGSGTNYMLGSLGIGTTAPSETLHIKTNETGVGASLLQLDNSGTASNEVGMNFYTSASDGGRYPTGRIYGKWDGTSYATSRLTLQSSTAGGLVDTLSIKAGNVGIATTSPTEAKLVINAGTGMALKAYGNALITGTLQTQTGSDFAEEFITNKKLEPGTVVVMGDAGHKSVKPCTKDYDKTVVGIVSNNPSIVAGRVEAKNKAIIAMMGVVKVKVSDVNGDIARGDMLTTSDIYGYAMKAENSKPGTIIGKALEDLEGSKGEINVLVNLQ